MNQTVAEGDIFVGVDGGATKTIVRLEDADGNFLAQGCGGPANISLSVETSWVSIHSALAEALQQVGISLNDDRYRFLCGAGLAGTEVSATCERFLDTPHPFAMLVLNSDAYTSCLGAHNGQDGAIIAIGTGVVAYQVECGKTWQVGGWGFPQADEGSGAWLGLEAIRLTLQWRDGRSEYSPLLETIFARFNNELVKLVVWTNQTDATQFAQIAPLVCLATSLARN